jgi:ABC-type transport system involved in multi-copper enzyme maturation permease subunit
MTTVGSPALARDHHTRTNPVWQVKAEIMKVRTTKLRWLFLIGLVLVTAWDLLRKGASHHYQLYPPLDRLPPSDRAQAVAQAADASTHAGGAAIATDMLTAGQFLGVLLAMLLGLLIVTNEYAHQTATATFLTNPNRGAVIAAKFATAVAVGVLFWIVSTAIDLIVTPIYLNSQRVPIALTEWVPVRSMLLNLLAYAMWGVFGVGLGSLFRSQVAAVVSAMAVYLVGAAAVLVVFNLTYLAYHHTWILGAPVVAPAVASLVMITPGRAFDHAPPQWAGLLSMTGYAVLLGTVGVVRTRRQDI